MEFLRLEETGSRGPRGHSFLLRWEETKGEPLQMSSGFLSRVPVSSGKCRSDHFGRMMREAWIKSFRKHPLAQKKKWLDVLGSERAQQEKGQESDTIPNRKAAHVGSASTEAEDDTDGHTGGVVGEAGFWRTVSRQDTGMRVSCGCSGDKRKFKVTDAEKQAKQITAGINE